MPTRYFKIVNWEQYQHYKDRNPPWVKLHKEILTSQTWVALADDSKLLAICIILVAAIRDNRIPLNPAYIKRIAYLDQTPDLKPLFEVGFIEELPQVTESDSASASNPLASDSNTLASGTERYPQRTENREQNNTNAQFDRFWDAYPRKVSKKKAQSAWRTEKADKHVDTILTDIAKRKLNGWKDPQFIPHPSTYLNQRRWEDEETQTQSTGVKFV